MQAATSSIACLTVPSLPLVCELIGRAHLHDQALALSDATATHVVEATEKAQAYGIHPGMTLRDAVALCPTLDVLESRPALVAQAAQALVKAMANVSPLVEEVEPGTVPRRSAAAG